VTLFVRASIPVIVVLSKPTTQTPSRPAAIRLANVSIVAMSLPVRGSMREIVPSRFPAHTAPAPTAMPG
jgi:hypothetical protein